MLIFCRKSAVLQNAQNRIASTHRKDLNGPSGQTEPLGPAVRHDGLEETTHNDEHPMGSATVMCDALMRSHEIKLSEYQSVDAESFASATAFSVSPNQCTASRVCRCSDIADIDMLRQRYGTWRSSRFRVPPAATRRCTWWCSACR
jgi:hypothetical protein